MSSAGMMCSTGSTGSTSISEPSQSSSLSASAVSFCTVMHRDAPCLLEGHIPGRDGFFGKKVLEVTEEKSAEIQFQTGTSMLKSRPGDPEFLQTLMLSAQRIVYLVYLC